MKQLVNSQYPSPPGSVSKVINCCVDLCIPPRKSFLRKLASWHWWHCRMLADVTCVSVLDPPRQALLPRRMACLL
uniref:Uncharacterized protein n=1 Tax=Anguilla anguilla TaxID=7936 RepID=A0A0E9U791_ANGAN